ncbi:hypothetical protein ACVQ92_06830 [Staphylococcus aureus]
MVNGISKPSKKRRHVSQYKWNAYIRSNIHWQNYIGNSMSKSNQFYIQRINESEFDPNIIRLGTGEVIPKVNSKSFVQRNNIKQY